MKKYDLVVIGGGPAAIAIAKNVKDKMKVVLIRPEDYSMVYCALPYAIEKLIPIENTFKKDAIVTDENVDLLRDRVVDVSFEDKTVQTEKNSTISYEKLIIATGATPVLPRIEGVSLKNVMTFKTEIDLRAIMKIVDNGLSKAVVVGAGAIGIELAQALNSRNVETHLIDMADQILPNMIDEEMVKEPQESLVASGIKLHLNNKVESLTGSEYVEKIVLGNEKTIDFDDNGQSGLVVFAVGMKPSVELFENSDLNIGHDGIIINNKMETNIEDVYAIGDCCQFTSGITNEILSGKLATNAVPMGRVLAHNLLGANRVYPGFYNGAATKVNEFFIGSSGFNEAKAREMFDVVVGYAELTTIFPVMPNAKKIKLKLIADKKTRTIIGGQFVSGEPVADKTDQITMIIQYKITLDQLVDFSYSAQPYQSFFPANNLIIQASENILKDLSELKAGLKNSETQEKINVIYN